MGSKPRHDTRSQKSIPLGPAALREAMFRHLPLHLPARGELIMPAAPALVDHYTELLGRLFHSISRTFTPPELQGLRAKLLEQMVTGFARSPTARLRIAYQTFPPPTIALNYQIEIIASTIAEEYEHWVKFRKPPLFGTHPDAKVVQMARSLAKSQDMRILDIGAGTGRNTLPLAAEGFSTDAVELAPALAEVLRQDAEKRELTVGVFCGDVLDRSLGPLAGSYSLLVMAEVIASHCRGFEHMQRFFVRAAELLKPGGFFLFSTFVTAEGYKPSDLERQLGECFWTTLCSRKDLADAMENLPLQKVSDEPVFEFEKENLPKENWPPTGWFVSWVNACDLFDVPHGRAPAELRWLVYRRLP